MSTDKTRQKIEELLRATATGAQPPIKREGKKVIHITVAARILGLAREAAARLLEADREKLRLQEKLAQMEAENEELKKIIREDSLTKAFTRDHLHGTLKAYFEEVAPLSSKRQKIDTSCLLMIDLDGFKAINDTYGHAAGDKALQYVADFLKSFMRKTDIVARVGGDEFNILMLGTTEENARMKCEMLEKGFETLHFEWQGKIIPLKASIGCCVFNRANTLDAVIESADHAMYEEKCRKNGKPVPQQQP